MSFRSLDLGKYDLGRVSFQKAIPEEAARDIIGVIDEPAEDLHHHDYHPYTIQGSKYWAELHVFRRADVGEGEDRPCGFEVTLWAGEPEDPPGSKLIRRNVEEMIDTAGAVGDDDLFVVTANFSFSSDDYHSPLIPAGPDPDLEKVTSGLSQEYTLHPSGARFTAEDVWLDVIVDTVPGPVSVRVQTAVAEGLSLESMRESIKDLHEIAELFVDRVPEGENGN